MYQHCKTKTFFNQTPSTRNLHKNFVKFCINFSTSVSVYSCFNIYMLCTKVCCNRYCNFNSAVQRATFIVCWHKRSLETWCSLVCNLLSSGVEQTSQCYYYCYYLWSLQHNLHKVNARQLFEHSCKETITEVSTPCPNYKHRRTIKSAVN